MIKKFLFLAVVFFL